MPSIVPVQQVKRKPVSLAIIFQYTNGTTGSLLCNVRQRISNGAAQLFGVLLGCGNNPATGFATVDQRTCQDFGHQG